MLVDLLLESVSILAPVVEVVLDFVGDFGGGSEGRRVTPFCISVLLRGVVSVSKLDSGGFV